MNILIANWTWYPSGGDWTTVENLIRLYEKNGHKVIPFSMKDERNFKSDYDSYFVSKIDYKNLNKKKTIHNSFQVITRSFYSTEAKKNLVKLFNSTKIDLVHLHNYLLYLTPSILPVIKRHNIPIIWTLHDYSLICPAVSFVSSDKICEACKGKKYYNCFLHKCKKNSYRASLIAALQNYFNSIWNIDKYIDYYITPSKFLKQKFVEFGYNENKLVNIYNPFEINTLSDFSESKTLQDNNYILYLGRLEIIKGLETLIRAMKLIRNTTLYIVGDGTASEYLKKMVIEESIKNVNFFGKLGRKEVLQYLQNCQFTICPSEWYENLPYSVVESMAFSKPVVASKIGGIPELVVDGYTGLLFNSGNVEDLVEKINILLNDKSKTISFGQNAKKHISELVDPDVHYEQLQNIFSRLNINS
jgi:glycosyltransferase involved in cell wall biosynthesis